MTPINASSPAVRRPITSCQTASCRSCRLPELAWLQSTTRTGSSPAALKSRRACRMPALPWFTPDSPPRSTTWPHGFPRVRRAQHRPSSSMASDVCGCRIARTALTAARTLPAVLFFTPTAIGRPLAIWRCGCDSAVRAPIAAQLTRSPTYACRAGLSISTATGIPSAVIRRRTRRTSRSPPARSSDASSAGSCSRPRQPVTVRGFST